ncbi:disease resistance protein RGA3 [Pyrus ussuriensis x Pyrus communis]|uniref:Disease resistance protein RGA3 n=1 Tax=Pyrus ussuriensis x Pyrus communis TaxID=2448454 RepID=A0A5N5FD11_9ROSA|nr:disease resistance protein RGA3 [Pyrus ussuriensis x Pyrus communis]
MLDECCSTAIPKSEDSRKKEEEEEEGRGISKAFSFVKALCFTEIQNKGEGDICIRLHMHLGNFDDSPIFHQQLCAFSKLLYLLSLSYICLKSSRKKE